ncbi:hypothetical protein Agub_g12898, partial [Astrephomene gubernaculifera]
MDRDLLAAAAAAGADVCDVEMRPAPKKLCGDAMPGADGYVPYDDPGVFELPSVDDLEVAAAAAAAALEVLAPKPATDSDSSSDDDDDDDSSSDEDSDDDSDDSSDDSDDSDDDSSTSTSSSDDTEEEAKEREDSNKQKQKRAAAAATASVGPICVRLLVDETAGRVTLRLVASGKGTAGAAGADADVAMREVETDSSPLSSSSDDEGDDDAAAAAAAASNRMVDEEELEALDHDGLRALITRAYAQADAEDEDEEGGASGGGGRSSALQDLGLPPAAPELAGVEVAAGDVLEPAGTCLSVLEGMVVMQGLANSRPLADGSVVVSEDRTVLGEVEEVFGPITQPLYAFRHAAVKGALPECVKPGAALFVVPRLARHIAPEEIYGPGGRCPEPEPASDDEVYFSDDEAEQHYMRQQIAKRKGGPEAGPEGGAGGGTAGGAGAAAGGRPRQRSRGAGSAAASGSGRGGPSTQFRVAATAGAMSALLGLGGGE